MRKKQILIAVLNWGLGHATRCIPLIRDIEAEGHTPLIASNGESLELLRKEFPHLKYLELPAYPVSYPRNGKLFKWKFFLKAPLFLKTIIAEKMKTSEILKNYHIDGIISDNRLGIYTGTVPSAYITHQINLLSGNTTFFTSRLHQYFIHKFSECWVPDIKGKDNLSGRLSDSQSIKVPVKYLGIQSRLRKIQLPQKYDITILLSGPEPQRSLLEDILLKEFWGTEKKVLLVRGKIKQQNVLKIKGNIRVLNFLTGTELETALNQSRLILSRSGYSTLIDLYVLGKKAFLIPTPGQPEQEYLAQRMQDLGIAPFCNQKNFKKEKLNRVSAYSGFPGSSECTGASRFFSLFEGE